MEYYSPIFKRKDFFYKNIKYNVCSLKRSRRLQHGDEHAPVAQHHILVKEAVFTRRMIVYIITVTDNIYQEGVYSEQSKLNHV